MSAATADTVERRRRLGIASALVDLRDGRHDDDLSSRLKRLSQYQLRALARLVDEDDRP